MFGDCVSRGRKVDTVAEFEVELPPVPEPRAPLELVETLGSEQLLFVV